MSDGEKFHGWRGGEPLRGLPVPPGMSSPPRVFEKGKCRVLVSHEDHSGKMRWHLSISCKSRYPDWEEIKDARYCLLPLGVTFAMILPPPHQYLNLHPNCFHLWEIEEAEW